MKGPSPEYPVTPQVAQPQLDEPAAPTVWGKLKWYNPDKRYGFVELSDGSGDAFLHASALASISVDALQPGVTIEFRTAGPCARVGRSRSKSGPRRKLAVTQIAIRDLPTLGECDFSVRPCPSQSGSVFAGNLWETYGPPLSK